MTSAIVLATTLLLSACGDDDSSGSTSPLARDRSDCQLDIFAQNQYPAPNGSSGAAGRERPAIESDQLASFEPNEPLTAIGFVETVESAYPSNPESIDGDRWFLVQKGDEWVWVNEAAVRDQETTFDSTGTAAVVGAVEPEPGCDMTELFASTGSIPMG